VAAEDVEHLGGLDLVVLPSTSMTVPGLFVIRFVNSSSTWAASSSGWAPGGRLSFLFLVGGLATVLSALLAGAGLVLGLSSAKRPGPRTRGSAKATIVTAEMSRSGPKRAGPPRGSGSRARGVSILDSVEASLKSHGCRFGDCWVSFRQPIRNCSAS